MLEVDTNAVYKQLKKQNGERVAHVIREALLLDVPNIVHILEFAGNNPDEVKQLTPIIREIYKIQKKSEYQTDKKPLELLNDAGYDAFVADTLEKQNSIKKFFRPGEELCTFRDPTRYEKNYIIHAIKRGADKIEPLDNPERQDEYGTSVISIQIAKTGGFISIKNRYNHTVNDPDATFNDNPDEIIPGLTNSLKKYFNVFFNTSESEMPGNFRMVNDQLVRYNYEIHNIYFGADYYFSGSEIIRLNNDYELMLDCFVLDVRDGKIKNIAELDKYGYPADSTYDFLSDLFNGKKVKIELDSQNKKEKIVSVDGQKLLRVVNGQITELFVPGVTNTEKNLLTFTEALKKLDMPDVREIGDNFCVRNAVLNSLHMPKLQKTGKDFLTSNRDLIELNLPELVKMGPYSLQNNHKMESIYVPKCESDIGFLQPTQPNLKHFYAPLLQDERLNYFALNSTAIAMQIARMRVHKFIDDMANDARKKLNIRVVADKSQNAVG